MIGIGPYSMLSIEYFLMLDEMPLRVIDHDPKTIDQPAKYMFPNPDADYLIMIGQRVAFKRRKFEQFIDDATCI